MDWPVTKPRHLSRHAEETERWTFIHGVMDNHPREPHNWTAWSALEVPLGNVLTYTLVHRCTLCHLTEDEAGRPVLDRNVYTSA